MGVPVHERIRYPLCTCRPTAGAFTMRILIIGAGGHGRVVADALIESRRAGALVDPVGFLDDDASRIGRVYASIPVIGGLDARAQAPHDAVIVAIGDNATRARVIAAMDAAGERLAISRHPTAIVAPDVETGAGSMISAGARITTGTRLGRGVIVNTGAIVDHDATIGDSAHVAPGVVLGGDVVIGAGTLVGLGARVLPGVCIGKQVTIGAGAVVLADVPDGVTYAGVPARLIAPRP
jgi:sugar O-acyltransferase (sialic acid O-acetyltransferase NeuD family)